MKNNTKAAALGAGLGMVAFALLTPSLASGNARTTIGTGKAAAAVAKPFVAMLLGGAEEVPNPGDPDGTGAAAVTIDPATNEVCWDIRVANIATATAAHIHRGARGASGPVVVDFASSLPNPTAAGCIMATPGIAAEIVGNPAGFYVNVHTADFPGGAVRGQLAAASTVSGQTQLLTESVRAYDSRTVASPMKINAGETRTISLATGLNGAGATVLAVPPGAVAAIIRITVDQPVGGGFLKVYSAALATPPTTASVNWAETGAIEGADTTVAVDALGQVKVTAGVNSTHFIIDVFGYIY